MLSLSRVRLRMAAFLLMGLCAAALHSARAADPAAPLRVCLVSGSLEYKSNESLAEFQKFLESNYRVKCTRAFLPGSEVDNLPGLENLDQSDVMLLFTRRLNLSGEQLERIKNYCLAGKPIVGVRTASHAIQSWLDLDKEVLGGNYHGHYGADSGTDVKIVERAKDHPLLAGVRPFHSAGSLYKNEGLSADNDILMTGTNPEATEPITWTRTFKGARIFYTSLGHPKDFEEAGFRQLLVNALFWTTGRTPQPRESDIEIRKDVVYGTAAGEELKLDLAKPKGSAAPRPGIVWIHGGAWRGGNKGEFEGALRQSAAAGYVAISINYRLVPKFIFPAQVEDSKCAVRWFRANAAELGLDPDRIGAVGSSAGAHLAMMLGAMGSEDGLEGDGGSAGTSSRVRAVVSFAGPTDLAQQFPIASNKLVQDFIGGEQSEKQDAARRASPITYVNSGDPPMLLIQGTRDPLVPHAQAIAMAEALTKVGVPGRVELMLGEGHGWPQQHERVMRATFEFLDRNLKY
jgi:acetyl esterase/lipase